VPAGDADLPITAISRRRHRRAVARLVDDERRRRGLRPLRHAPSLSLSARHWAGWIVRHSRFTHGNFQRRSRRSPYARISRRLHRRWRAGEALAWGTGDASTPRAIVGAWMDSPEHRALLLGHWEHGAVWSVHDAPAPGAQADGVTVVHEFGWRGR
jgi:uncharacterized protein YkwD